MKTIVDITDMLSEYYASMWCGSVRVWIPCERCKHADVCKITCFTIFNTLEAGEYH